MGFLFMNMRNTNHPIGGITDRSGENNWPKNLDYYETLTLLSAVGYTRIRVFTDSGSSRHKSVAHIFEHPNYADLRVNIRLKKEVRKEEERLRAEREAQVIPSMSSLRGGEGNLNDYEISTMYHNNNDIEKGNPSDCFWRE